MSVCVLKLQVTYRIGGGHIGMHCSSAGGAATNLPLTALSGASAGWQLVHVEGSGSLRHSESNRAGQEEVNTSDN